MSRVTILGLGALVLIVAVRLAAFQAAGPSGIRRADWEASFPHAPLVALMFQETDCYGFRPLAAALERLRRTGIEVVAVSLTRGRAAHTARVPWVGRVPTVTEGELYTFVLGVSKRLGLDRTPTLVLFDAEGRLRMVLPPSVDPVVHRRQLTLLMEYAEAVRLTAS